MADLFLEVGIGGTLSFAVMSVLLNWTIGEFVSVVVAYLIAAMFIYFLLAKHIQVRGI